MGLEKRRVDLAVFDLDGTLYRCNSHIEILSDYYGLRLFDCFAARVFGRMFGTAYLRLLTYFYNRIPTDRKSAFSPEFRAGAVRLLRKKQEDGFEVVIVSNAPTELIRSAAERLCVDWLRADVNRKNEAVAAHYAYERLFVCTDNVSDANLLDMADERVIYVSGRTKRFFSRRYPDATLLEV